VLAIAGASLVKQKPLPEECELPDVPATVELCEEPGAEFGEAVRSKRFALLWFIGLMAFTPGLTVMCAPSP
jgi:hypothetical protein